MWVLAWRYPVLIKPTCEQDIEAISSGSRVKINQVLQMCAVRESVSVG
jgi:hypothetical protein